jgi:hypothetical protein
MPLKKILGQEQGDVSYLGEKKKLYNRAQAQAQTFF